MNKRQEGIIQNTEEKEREREKREIEEKGNSSSRPVPDEVVLERGYDEEDEFFLHPQQTGRVAGVEAVESWGNRQWATAGLEGRTVRRLQSEGSRYDSEAISSHALPAHSLSLALSLSPADASPSQAVVTVSPRDTHGYNNIVKDLPGWKRLEENDLIEMESYTMAVAEDPARRRKLLPSAIAKSKIKFLWQEVFGDFTHGQRGSFEFYMNIFVFIISFWMRIYIHYAVEYLYLQSIGTPVYGFELQVYQLNFKYMSNSITQAQETGVVALGPVGCLVFFFGLGATGFVFHRYANVFPDAISMFIAAFGVWTALDPLLIMTVDILVQNFDCANRHDICGTDYTSSNCNCFEGDFVKLWVRMQRDEGSGISGLLITFMLYIGTFITSCLMLHEYLVHVHKDARVVDLWRRIHAPAEEFFLPTDFEISQQELLDITREAERWRGPNGASRKLVISDYVDRDPYDPDYEERTVHYAIYEMSLSTGQRTLHRHFLMLPNGSIIEVFEKLPIALSSLNKYMETLFDKKRSDNDAVSKRSDGGTFRANKNLFAGLEKV